MRSAPSLNPLQRREVALAALCDERTLSRALRGAAVQPSSRERIRRALEARGLTHLLTDAEAGR